MVADLYDLWLECRNPGVFRHMAKDGIHIFNCRLGDTKFDLIDDVIKWLGDHTSLHEVTPSEWVAFTSPSGNVEITYNSGRMVVCIKDRNDLAMLFKLRWT